MDFGKASTALRCAILVCGLILATNANAQSYKPGVYTVFRDDTARAGQFFVDQDTIQYTLPGGIIIRIIDSMLVAPIELTVEVGMINYGNQAIDTLSRVIMNQLSYPLMIGTAWGISRFMLLSAKVGSSPVLTSLATPPIASPDSSIGAVKIVRQGGIYYFVVNKYYVPGLGNPFSPPATGGTNMVYEPISSALFPTLGTSVQIKVKIWLKK